MTLLLVAIACSFPQEPEPLADPMLGSWAFRLPDGGPAWLDIRRSQGKPQAALLWSVGSARTVSKLRVEGNRISFVRNLKWQPGGDKNEVRRVSAPFQGELRDGKLVLTVTQTKVGSKANVDSKANAGSDEPEIFEIVGKRMPKMPARPDLSKVRFGPPVKLFNGKDLTGWKLSNPKKKNGWHVVAGELVNTTPKSDFRAYGDHGNLITERDFHDFRLIIEYNVPRGGNSGIYLRGMYEAQVVDRDSKMQGISGPGAVFGRIKPTKNAGKPGGDWNRYVLTLVDRHMTIELNGEIVVDNRAVPGCTGGGMSADDTAAGPIFLQGDHTSVRYRNIIIEPRLMKEPGKDH